MIFRIHCLGINVFLIKYFIYVQIDKIIRTPFNYSKDVGFHHHADFILPIDFNSENHDLTLENRCGDVCKYKIAKAKGLIKIIDVEN